MESATRALLENIGDCGQGCNNYKEISRTSLSFPDMINPRRACAGWLKSWLVCLLSQYLTSGASVRPKNTVTHSAGNGGQYICGFFFETARFKSYGVKRKRKTN